MQSEWLSTPPRYDKDKKGKGMALDIALFTGAQ